MKLVKRLLEPIDRLWGPGNGVTDQGELQMIAE